MNRKANAKRRPETKDQTLFQKVNKKIIFNKFQSQKIYYKYTLGVKPCTSLQRQKTTIRTAITTRKNSVQSNMIINSYM